MSLVELRKTDSQEALSQESAFLYRPHYGSLHLDEPKKIDGGELQVAHYSTNLARHTSGLYKPEDYKAGESPVVVMHGAWWTGVRGHNEIVATEMMQDGAAVVMFGQPRYHFPQSDGLSMIADANEMMGFVARLSDSPENQLGPLEKLYAYGESQGAMKALILLAIGPLYGRPVVDGLIAAPRFVRPMNPLEVGRNVKDVINMGISGFKYALGTSPKDLWEMRKTFELKDMHAHTIVARQLLRGQPGQALPVIEQAQKLDVDLYGHDGTPEAYATARRLRQDFPNMSVDIHRHYGHIDGIMSPETRQRRREMIARAVGSTGLTAA